MSHDPQVQSTFVNRLPREVRDAIYLDLWRSCGLRQHIVWHGTDADKHFCRWSCTTEFQVEDELQQDIEKLRAQLGVVLGEEIQREIRDNVPPYCRRLQSPWINHWLCGERGFEKHGLKAIWGLTTSTIVCWKTNKGKHAPDGPSSSSYLPMLLLCKLISDECLQSIYESTTFIFTDPRTIQMFFGQCALHPAMRTMRTAVTPPAFFEYARSLELSLSPDFPATLVCANYDLPGIPRRHDVYDFHWLRLDRFRSLRQVNIWIAARSLTCGIEANSGFRGIKEFSAGELKDVLAPFKTVGSVTLSTPLGQSISPHKGYVDVGADFDVQVYKRGVGDRFHPLQSFIELDHYYDRLIFTSCDEEVRLARHDGDYVLMKDV